MELSQLVIPWGQSAKLTREVRGNPALRTVAEERCALTSSQRSSLSRRPCGW